MEYSKYQTEIFDFAKNGSGHGSIHAGAGTGKTFTGVEMTRYIPSIGMGGKPKTVFLAFNKHIQEELARKLPEWVIAKTYHSFGLSAIPMREFKIDSNKNYKILKAQFGYENQSAFPTMSRLAGLLKGNLIPQADATPELINQYIDHYGIELGDDEDKFDDIAWGAKLLLDPVHCERLKMIDFDDMIWYPLVRNLPIPSQDYLLVDEFQDSNEAQMELVLRAKNSHGRIFAIGDPNQAIYGWRGAGTQGMEIFSQRTDATQLPLSISYRCPKSVVQLVNQKFPHIPYEAWDQAIEGSVNQTNEEKMFQTLLPGDMVLCRLNAPLVAPAMRLLRMGKKAIIRGRDIGKNLLQMIQKIERTYYPESIGEFLQVMQDYVEKEGAKLRAVERHSQADLLADKAETIFAFADGVDTVSDMKCNIEAIFSDDQEGITFSSGHRAKGLEAPNVYILHPELFPFKRAKTPEAKAQEINLHYVICTRPKISLNFVQG